MIGVLEQGFIFCIMALGVYITFKILNFPDMSVDGTFPLGASVTAILLLKGINPWLACIISIIAGMIGGLITGVLHVKFKIPNLLSGILIMLALYSVNLRIMGKANTPFFNERTIFSSNMPPLLVVVVLGFFVKLLLDIIFKTKFGFILKATGDNPNMVTSLGIDIGLIKILGIMMANGLVALSGSVMAQYQRFSDVGMGTGVLIMGLASIIMGESILRALPIKFGTSCAILGSLLYKGSIAAALKAGLPATDLRLITSVIVITALTIYNGGINIRFKKRLHLGGVKAVTNSKSA
ncbi:MAG: ABC transporter permease [Clostridiales bacterium]|jgi:putative ABC transport system permease protein|nr:ABC transporter permease [Clostridiales bacterium]